MSFSLNIMQEIILDYVQCMSFSLNIMKEIVLQIHGGSLMCKITLYVIPNYCLFFINRNLKGKISNFVNSWNIKKRTFSFSDDHARVPLIAESPDEVQYINACYIDVSYSFVELSGRCLFRKKTNKKTNALHFIEKLFTVHSLFMLSCLLTLMSMRSSAMWILYW